MNIRILTINEYRESEINKELTDLEADVREKICDFGLGSICLLRALSIKPIAMFFLRPHSQSLSLGFGLFGLGFQMV